MLVSLPGSALLSGPEPGSSFRLCWCPPCWPPGAWPVLGALPGAWHPASLGQLAVAPSSPKRLVLCLRVLRCPLCHRLPKPQSCLLGGMAQALGFSSGGSPTVGLSANSAAAFVGDMGGRGCVWATPPERAVLRQHVHPPVLCCWVTPSHSVWSPAHGVGLSFPRWVRVVALQARSPHWPSQLGAAEKPGPLGSGWATSGGPGTAGWPRALGVCCVCVAGRSSSQGVPRDTGGEQSCPEDVTVCMWTAGSCGSPSSLPPSLVDSPGGQSSSRSKQS